MHVIFFGGSFNPVHVGHLILAETLWHRFRPDHFLFVPTGRNPLKTTVNSAAPQDRLAMLNLALADSPFTVWEHELQQSGPSYTIDTVEELRQQFGADTKLSMVIGADLLQQLDDWKDRTRLETELEFLILPRAGVLQKSPRLPRHHQWLKQVPRLDISSSMIRRQLQEQQLARHTIPDAVYEYIQNHHLYTT